MKEQQLLLLSRRLQHYSASALVTEVLYMTITLYGVRMLTEYAYAYAYNAVQ